MLSVLRKSTSKNSCLKFFLELATDFCKCNTMDKFINITTFDFNTAAVRRASINKEYISSVVYDQAFVGPNCSKLVFAQITMKTSPEYCYFTFEDVEVVAKALGMECPPTLDDFGTVNHRRLPRKQGQSAKGPTPL